MKLKSNFRCDRYGNIYYRKTINGNRVTIPAYTKDVSIANKLYKTLKYQALMDYYSPKPNFRFDIYENTYCREMVNCPINHNLYGPK